MIIKTDKGETVQIDESNAYLTVASKVIEQWHRSKVILHQNYQYFLGEYKTLEDFKAFADRIGITFEEIGTEHHEGYYGRTANGGSQWYADPYDVTYYKLSHRFQEGECHVHDGGRFPYFWSVDEVPLEAKPLVLSSNGSRVIGYFTNADGYVTLYRPNPNAKAVYRPIPYDWDSELPALN